MTQIALSTIPSKATATGILYLPEIHSRSGSYFPDIRRSDMTKAAVVSDIVSSQHDDVIRVIAIDIVNGKSWDASQEIAQAVLDDILNDYSTVPMWCRPFCEEYLGIGKVNRAEREAA